MQLVRLLGLTDWSVDRTETKRMSSEKSPESEGGEMRTSAHRLHINGCSVGKSWPKVDREEAKLSETLEASCDLLH